MCRSKMVETRSTRTGNNTFEEHITAKPNDAPTAKPNSGNPMPSVVEVERGNRLSISSLSFRVIEDINKKLSPHQKDVFTKTCFGPFLKLERFHYSAMLIDRVMRQSTFSEKDSDPVALVIAGKSCEFGLREFSLITGLNCSEFATLPRDSYGGETRGRIRRELFGGKKYILCEDVARRFNSCHERDSDSDVIKLAQLYLLEGFLLCKRSRKDCDELSVSLVDDPEEFNKFPWGRYVYECTVKSLRRRFEGPGNSQRLDGSSGRYMTSGTLKGFPFALQCWALEMIPRIRGLCGARAGLHTPRMLNWSFFDKQPRLKVFERVFNDKELLVESGLEATEIEMHSDYYRYFLGEQEPKRRKRARVIEDMSPSQLEKSVKSSKIDKNNRTPRNAGKETVDNLGGVPKRRKRTQIVEDKSPSQPEKLVKIRDIAKNNQTTPMNARNKSVDNMGEQDPERRKKTQIVEDKSPSQPEKLVESREIAKNNQTTPTNAREENVEYLKSQITALKKELKAAKEKKQKLCRTCSCGEEIRAKTSNKKSHRGK